MRHIWRIVFAKHPNILMQSSWGDLNKRNLEFIEAHCERYVFSDIKSIQYVGELHMPVDVIDAEEQTMIDTDAFKKKLYDIAYQFDPDTELMKG